MNKVILIGRVGQDPETKQVGETTLAKFSLATSETYKNKQGEKVEDTTWHNIEMWGKLADIAEKHVNKGDLLAIEGKIKIDMYEKDGEKKSITKVKADSMKMLGGKQEKASTPKAQQSHKPKQEYANDEQIDDLPF